MFVLFEKKKGIPCSPFIHTILRRSTRMCRGDEEELEMYADDTTLTCIGETVDQVVSKLNKTLDLVNDWCQRNWTTVHPEKSEAMPIKRGKLCRSFTTNVVKWKFGEVGKEIKIFGKTLDDKLKWKEYRGR